MIGAFLGDYMHCLQIVRQFGAQQRHALRHAANFVHLLTHGLTFCASWPKFRASIMHQDAS